LKWMQWKITALTLSFVLIVGCTSPAKEAEPEKEKAEIPEPAETVEGMLKEGPGKYAGKNYDKQKVNQYIKKLPKDLSAEEYYKHLVYLLAENYEKEVEDLNNFDTSLTLTNDTPNDSSVKKGKGENSLNVTILLDASGSMAGTVDGGVKMDLAKAAIKRFASSLPSHAQVSLRVYGHQGSNREKDKAKSCASTEEVYPRSAYSEKKFNQALDQFKPTGWTPIAKGMEEAYQDLKGADKAENLIYVVSDGVETCGGNPEKMAKKLNQSNIQAMVNIIGFDVDNEGQQSLKNVAEAGGGKYETVQSEEELRDYFDDLQTEMWLEWSDWGTFSWLEIDEKQYTRLSELEDIIYKRLGRKITNEEERMYNVCDYMREELSIESGKVDDLSDRIGERNDKLETYKEERYESLKDSLMSNALEMKDKIEEMKDKKLNQYD